MITGHQVLQGRLLLKWNLQQLARAARLPLNATMRAELLDRQAIGTAVHATALRKALEAAGIEFPNDGAPGVQLRKVQPVTSVYVFSPARLGRGQSTWNRN